MADDRSSSYGRAVTCSSRAASGASRCRVGERGRRAKRSRGLRRLRDLAADPRAALLVDHYDDDWSALWWVELRGTASTLESEAAGAALDALAARYPPYLHARPPGPVIAILPHRWTWWSAR